jgi:hypothetical protein
MTPTRHRLRTGALATLAVALLLAGCGSDSSDSAGDDGSGATDAAGADGADAGAFCDAYLSAERDVISLLFTQQGDPDEVTAKLDGALALAPDDVAGTMQALVEGGKAQLSDPEAGATDETLQAYSDSLGWVSENCDIETIDVTAQDYRFEGIPESLEAGDYIVRFDNQGSEFHEVFAGRFNDGVTDSIEDIVRIENEDEVMQKITPVNAQDAAPGDVKYVSWHLEEPGRYFAVCFVSVGSVNSFDEGGGNPHVEEGMVQEFTVT